MTHSSTARYIRCSHIGAAVRVDRTEGQCRDQHQCSIYLCPLEKEFTDERPRLSMHSVAAGWINLFPTRSRRG